MSSYLYDPHSIRQKPNRYYQRKGQIIRAKHNDIINQAISKDEAEKYKQAVYNYFPVSIPESQLKIEFNTKEILANVPKQSVILNNQLISNIDGTEERFCIIVTKQNDPPAILTTQQTQQYTWLNIDEAPNIGDNSYEFQAYYNEDRLLSPIDAGKSFFVSQYINGSWDRQVRSITSNYNLYIYHFNGFDFQRITYETFINIYCD